jgi:protein PhnA
MRVVVKTAMWRSAPGRRFRDLIRDLKIKGSSVVLKRGTLIKNILLADDPAEIDCRADNAKGLVLRTEFVRRA